METGLCQLTAAPIRGIMQPQDEQQDTLRNCFCSEISGVTGE
jgi:hypothetical protein